MNGIQLYSLKIEDLNWVKVKITTNYKIKNVKDSNWYLSMKTERDFDILTLFQPLFIKNLLKKFLMNDCHSATTPIKENVDFMNDDEKLIVYTAEFTLHFYQLNIEFL